MTSWRLWKRHLNKGTVVQPPTGIVLHSGSVLWNELTQWMDLQYFFVCFISHLPYTHTLPALWTKRVSLAPPIVIQPGAHEIQAVTKHICIRHRIRQLPKGTSIAEGHLMPHTREAFHSETLGCTKARAASHRLWGAERTEMPSAVPQGARCLGSFYPFREYWPLLRLAAMLEFH